jgi:Mitochondrial ribosomal subunit S27
VIMSRFPLKLGTAQLELLATVSRRIFGGTAPTTHSSVRTSKKLLKKMTTGQAHADYYPAFRISRDIDPVVCCVVCSV